MKPNWEDAPEWAEFRCMNRYSQWFWCAERPVADEISFHFSGQTEITTKHDEPLVFKEKWRDSIEERP